MSDKLGSYSDLKEALLRLDKDYDKEREELINQAIDLFDNVNDGIELFFDHAASDDANDKKILDRIIDLAKTLDEYRLIQDQCSWYLDYFGLMDKLKDLKLAFVVKKGKEIDKVIDDIKVKIRGGF